MTIGLTGKVALNANINTEFQLGNAMSTYRGVAYYKPSTATLGNFESTNLNFGEFYGTSDKVTADITISTNTQNYTLNPAAVAGYVANFSEVTLTVDSGIFVGSASTGSYAMTITGFGAGDTINLINNGTIIGAGGNGGDSPVGGTGNPGNAGGNAILLQCPVRITNNGTIAGGGGGGGANDGGSIYGSCSGGGGSVAGQGGGGGAGYNAGSGGSGDPSGSSGTSTSGGGGGGNGGGQGIAGATSGSGRAGGSAGKYISGIAYATFISTGTLLGNYN